MPSQNAIVFVRVATNMIMTTLVSAPSSAKQMDYVSEKTGRLTTYERRDNLKHQHQAKTCIRAYRELPVTLNTAVRHQYQNRCKVLHSLVNE
jgi:hypothetical protein